MKKHYTNRERTFLKVATKGQYELSGTFTNIDNTSYVIMAVAYQAGTYKGREVKGYKSNKEPFVDAEDISLVNKSLSSFSIQLQNHGNYELYFASFIDPDNNGELEFSGMLDVTSSAQTDINNDAITFDPYGDLLLRIEGIL